MNMLNVILIEHKFFKKEKIYIIVEKTIQVLIKSWKKITKPQYLKFYKNINNIKVMKIMLPEKWRVVNILIISESSKV